MLWLEDGQFKAMVTMAVDPVCGMAVEREGAPTAERVGETYFFCSRGCRDEFLGELRPETAAHAAQAIGLSLPRKDGL